MFLSIALFVFIYSQHACANVHFVKIHRHPTCPPLWKKTGGASSPFSGGKNRGAGFRSQKAGAGSDGKEEDRGSPVLIPSILRVSGAGAARTLMKTPSSKRVPPPPGAKHTQWKPLIMRSVSPLESRLCMLHSQSDHRTNCVYAARDIAWAGRNTVCNVIYFRPYLPLICLLPSLFLFSFVLISYLSLTNDSKLTHRTYMWLTHTQRASLNDRS